MGLLEQFGIKNGLTDFIGGHRSALTNFGAGLASGQTFGQGIALGTQGLAQGAQADDAYATAKKAEAERQTQINQTTEWLKVNYPQFASLPPAEGFALATQLIGQQKAGTLPSSIQEYEYGLTHPDFATSQKGGAAETSLTPLWVTDTDPSSPTYNQTVPAQLNKAGELIRTTLPANVAPVDPVTLAGDKAGTVVDKKTEAAARAALPGAEQAYALTQQALKVLQSPVGQAGAQEQFGTTLGLPNRMVYQGPLKRQGTPMANFGVIIDQLSGQAFLQIRQALKGAGQVTDFEGMKGEMAISRMKKAAEDGDQEMFNQAVVDFQTAIDNGIRLLREQANGGYADGAPAVTGGAPQQPGGVADPLGIR